MLSDGLWYNATASVASENSIYVTLNTENIASSHLKTQSHRERERGGERDEQLIAVGVRYAFADWPVTTLYNKDGLPAYPFIGHF